MKNTIIVIDSNEQCEAVQKKLFKMGIFWSSGCKEVQNQLADILLVDDLNNKPQAISYRARLPKDWQQGYLRNHVIVNAKDFL